MDKETSLIILTHADEMLSKASTYQELKEFKSIALTAADWAKRKGLGDEVIKHAKLYALLAEWKMGEKLKKTDRQKPGEYQRLLDVTVDPSLAKLGLTKRESSEAQILYELSEEIFKAIKEWRVSRQAAINEERRKRKRKELKKKSLLPGKKKYRIIYADPPWKYDQWLPHQYGDMAKIYPPMTIKEICAMPVKKICDENSVLFLWVTSPKLEQAFEVIKAWGFEYKTSFIWDKIKHNFGYYNSIRHELLLIAGKGMSTPDNKKLYDSVVSIERSKKHSEKPAYFRNLIDTLYTWGNRIELFWRGKKEEIKKGWEVFGNE